MIFSDYYERVCDLCIMDIEDTWSSYLRPDYKMLLKKNELTPDIVEDYDLSFEELSEMLNLEIAKRHAVTDKRRVVGEWIYEVINQVIDPSTTAGEADLINSIVSLMYAGSNNTNNGIEKMSKVINFAKRDTDSVAKN